MFEVCKSYRICIDMHGVITTLRTLLKFDIVSIVYQTLSILNLIHPIRIVSIITQVRHLLELQIILSSPIHEKMIQHNF